MMGTNLLGANDLRKMHKNKLDQGRDQMKGGQSVRRQVE